MTKKEKTEFYLIFRKIIQDFGKYIPKTIAEEAQLIGISTPQLSRLKSGKSALTNRVIDLIVQAFGENEETQKSIRERLDDFKDRQSPKESQHGSKTALEEFHERFFFTPRGDNRIICGGFFDLAQSTEHGRNPEYAERSADMICNGLSFASFQPWGPKEAIKDRIRDAVEAEDQKLIEAWSYIYKLAESVHEGFRKTKKSLESRENLGQLVLYEALKVPSLTNCNLHSRLYYGERISGENKIQIVQLLLGKIGNNDYTEHYIECSNESAFQSVVAEQFFPIVHYWRVKRKLPESVGEITAVLGKKIKCPWSFHKVDS